jgi:hypothetical protein
MNISRIVDELLESVIADFESDGMTIKMPDNVKLELKNEMRQRLWDTIDAVRDDAESDIRGFAFMPEEK